MTTTLPFAHCELDFFTRLQNAGFAPTCIVDVGASNAAWSTTLVQVFPDAAFELFEPLAGQHDDYDKVLQWALSTHQNLRMHAIALGAANTTAPLWTDADAVGSTLLSAKFPTNETIPVPVRRLDDYLAEHNIPQPQVIKIDVQGGELLVLEGAPHAVKHADILHIETWLTRGYRGQTPLLHEVIAHVRPLGHLLVQLGECWRKPTQELNVADAFFAHQRLIDRLTTQNKGFPWPQNWTP